MLLAIVAAQECSNPAWGAMNEQEKDMFRDSISAYVQHDLWLQQSCSTKDVVDSLTCEGRKLKKPIEELTDQEEEEYEKAVLDRVERELGDASDCKPIHSEQERKIRRDVVFEILSEL